MDATSITGIRGTTGLILQQIGMYRVLWRARQCISKIHHQNVTQWTDTYFKTDGKEQ